MLRKEKRISLRFRMDNDQDRKAWEILEAVAKERNTSKNAVAIDLILSGEMKLHSADELAERIAELVANKLIKELICIPMGSGASEEAVSGNDVSAEKADTDSRADEPELLGEEALDFLEMFG